MNPKVGFFVAFCGFCFLFLVVCLHFIVRIVFSSVLLCFLVAKIGSSGVSLDFNLRKRTPTP